MLYILTGLPGSGKPTWAARVLPNAVVVCKDDIREEICGNADNQSQNKRVRRIAMARAKEFLFQGKDVILDATHLTPKSRRDMAALAPKGMPVVIVWFDTSLKTCLERNTARKKFVPLDVIRRMHFNFVPPKKHECDKLIVVREKRSAAV